MSPTQIEERRKEGLCFNCDEKFQPEHQCKSAKLFLLEDIYHFQGPNSSVQLLELDESDVIVLQSNFDEPEPKIAKAEITLCALLGSPLPRTIRIKGKINGH